MIRMRDYKFWICYNILTNIDVMMGCHRIEVGEFNAALKHK